MTFGWCTRQYNELKENVVNRRKNKDEQRIAERTKKEQEEYFRELDREKADRREKVEMLKASGYIATVEERNKVIEIASTNPKTNLKWASMKIGISVEKLIIIIEKESEFEIRDEYIINNKTQLKSKV